MNYLTAIIDFLKTWFLPMPAHDDPRFMVTPPESETEPETASAPATAVAVSDPLKPETPVEQVYGEPPVTDPSVAEGMEDTMNDEDYDPAEDRDVVPGEPDENRDETNDADYETTGSEKAPQPEQTNAETTDPNAPIKKVDPLPASLPEAAEARASRTHARVNPFTDD